MCVRVKKYENEDEKYNENEKQYGDDSKSGDYSLSLQRKKNDE